MKLRFWKLAGAGNDFVLLQGLPRGHSGPALARRLCARRRGVGADGLLALTRRGRRLRLDYWNADGSAAFCGNGSRCAALWAASRGWLRGSGLLETAAGPLRARLAGRGRAELSMPAPRGLTLGRRLRALGRNWTAHSLNTGVPHAVLFVPDVERVDVRRLGRALRRHAAFGRAGANVDFVEARGKSLLLRTYERGVEDETPACGTGAVAAAFVAVTLGKARTPVPVRARSGDLLRVSIGSSGARLEGPAELVFEGEFEA